MLFIFPALHVAPVIKRTASGPKRRGREVIRITLRLPSLRQKHWTAEKERWGGKKTRTRPLYVLDSKGGGGSKGWRETGRFQLNWRVGKRGGGVSPVLISFCLLSFPANPETQPHSPAQNSRLPKMPPVSSKLITVISRSAYEGALLLAFWFNKRKKKKAGLYLSREGSRLFPLAMTLHVYQFLRQPASHPLHTCSLLSH